MVVKVKVISTPQIVTSYSSTYVAVVVEVDAAVICSHKRILPMALRDSVPSVGDVVYPEVHYLEHGHVQLNL